VTVQSISVVIPTFRRPDALHATLEALTSVEHGAADVEVVVVDDGADASTERVARAHDGGAINVRYASQTRKGAAAARNHGARIAEGELLIYCDDDVIVEPDHLYRHLAARQDHDDPLVNGVSGLLADTHASFRATAFGRLRLQLEHGYEQEADGRALGNDRFEAPFLSARNLAVRRGLFWELGGFDDSFPYAGAEDQDLSLRARHAGCLLIRDHSIRIAHNEQTLTLEQFCTREERSGQTVVVLARKFPAEGAQRRLVTENGPIRRCDPPALMAKKLAKSVLARDHALTALHRTVNALEHVPLQESHRHRLYRGLIGLHIYRGVHSGSFAPES
jgi:GT2 family glycosyltransferase